MRVTKRVVQGGVVVAGILGTAAVAAPESPVGRAVRRLADRLSRDVRYAVGAAPGILYRLAGRHPDRDVPDDVLADRVRSSIGPLLKKLDLPHVNVLVNERVATLHGDVGRVQDGDKIEHAVMAVSGIDGVISHLHVGLIEGDTRPSTGRSAVQPPSPALQALLDTAISSGASEPRIAVHAVLCRFLDRIPDDERDHVLGHLPEDVRNLVGPRHKGATTSGPARIRTMKELVDAVRDEEAIAPQFAEELTRRVVAVLHSIVADEADDVASVLPAELRELWLAAAPGS